MERQYKDSGIEWIGMIPEDWRISRLKFVLDSPIETGKRPNEPEGKVISIGGEHIQNGKFDLAHPMYITEGTYYANKGKINLHDTLVVKDGATIGKCMYVASMPYEKMLLNEHVYRIDCGKFYYYWILSEISQKWFRVRNQSTAQESITGPTIMNLPIVSLDVKEQNRIVGYLDKKCGEIDSLIGLQEQMIEKLKEYKRSVITEAVTKGINPNAQLVPSGISFIGNVPEGWSIVPLRYLGRTQNGISKSGEYFGEGDPFVSYSDVYKNYSLPSTVTGLAKSTEQDQLLFSVEEGDVFFTRTSETIDEIGFSCVCLNTIERAVFAGFLIRFRPYKNKLDKNFSKYFFRSSIHRAYFVKEMNLVTRASLSQELLKSMPVLLPSLDEQQAIASYLDGKCGEIDELIAVKQHKIEKLKDYKKSVIYEAVTGKINIES